MWYDFLHLSAPPQAVLFRRKTTSCYVLHLLALAISCAFTCTSYAQQPSSTQAAPPAASAAPNQPAQPMAGQQSTPAEAKPAPPARDVPMTEPVITLKGACPAKDGKVPQGCVTSLTREQFEKLTNALQPADRGPVPPEVRRRFATQYAKLLIVGRRRTRARPGKRSPGAADFHLRPQPDPGRGAQPALPGRVLPSHRSADRGLLQAEQEEVSRSDVAAHHHPGAAGKSGQAEGHP